MTHRRLAAFLTVALLAVCRAGAVTSPSSPRPNILLLFADDMRADCIAAHGNRHIRTPHLDRLAAQGFSFRGNYIFGANSGAVCIPSRAMLMTGRTWFHIDTLHLRGSRLLPEHLREHGYRTFATGKWHNGEESWLRGFQQGRAVMFGGMSDHTQVPVRDLGADGRLTPTRVARGFSSELFADAALEFLQGHQGDDPFFAYVAFTAPHDPRQPPAGWTPPAPADRPPLPPNFLPQFPFDNGMVKVRDEVLAAWPRDPETLRDQLVEYYALIEHLDQQVGRVLDGLRASRHATNTLVIFAADNGLALGSHGLLGKQSVFEHSMRVPLILAGPGIPAGRSTHAFTYLHDLFPTLCDLLGLDAPPDLEGASLRPLLDGTQPAVRDTVFLPFLSTQRAVRDERWKLIAYPEQGHLQLFDLQSDPHEITNLVARPEHAVHIARLRERLQVWQRQVGDGVAVPSSNREPAVVSFDDVQRKPDPWQPDWIVRKYFPAPR